MAVTSKIELDSEYKFQNLNLNDKLQNRSVERGDENTMSV